MGMDEKLLGYLIGLARATEGNEYLLTDSTAKTAAEGLLAVLDGQADAALLARCEAEKRKLVPMCYECAEPCGRTNDYDTGRLSLADPDIRALKERILLGARAVAQSILAGNRQAQDDQLLYRALFAVGREDWTAAELLAIARQTEQFCG